MYEWFDEGARRVLTFAHEEAARFSRNYVGTEHLLLGLLRAETRAVTILLALGVDPAAARGAIELIIGHNRAFDEGHIGLTTRGKLVLDLAAYESRTMGHQYLGAEHLLLGLLRVSDSAASGVLAALGVTLENARAQAIQLCGKSGPDERLINERGPDVNERFDKFNEGARKALTLAQEEAVRLNHNYIGTEHLLLAVVRVGDSLILTTLHNLGVQPNQVRTAVELKISHGDHQSPGEVGLTPRAKKVIELAVDEARRLGQRHIGAEHLLLGLLREGEGLASVVLAELGITFEQARGQVLQLLSKDDAGAPAAEPGDDAGGIGATEGPAGDGAGPVPGDRFALFTERARKVLSLAQEEATRFNHNYIGTEHILLGLMREGESVAARVLANLGVGLNQVRSAVEFIIGRGDRPVVGEIGLTPRAKKVIELAIDERRRLGHHYVGTEHLLLGLVREGEGIASGVLESVGVNLEKVRTQTIRVVSGGSAQVSTANSPSETRTRGAAHRAWEYRVMHVGHGERGALIRQIDGGEDPRFGLDRTPLHQALAVLGAEGWELVAIDHPGAGTLVSYYIFKRPPGSPPPALTVSPELP